MRQLTSRWVEQQSKFDCLIQGDSTHETGSFNPWIYLWGLAIQKPAAEPLMFQHMKFLLAYAKGSVDFATECKI